MRRVSIFLLSAMALLAGCGRERPASGPNAPATARKTAPTGQTTSAAPAAAPPAVKLPNRSTPDRCAGDGSYEQAVDCYRAASRIGFKLEEPNGVRADGEMVRQTIGAEKLRFKLAGSSSDDGEWTAEAKAAGVIWTHAGKRMSSVPPFADRLWQLTTLYIDPQKREGTAQRIGAETMHGEPSNHYRFTDANSSAVHDVWVSTTDGHVLAMKSESRPPFPSYTMTITGMGK